MSWTEWEYSIVSTFSSQPKHLKQLYHLKQVPFTSFCCQRRTFLLHTSTCSGLHNWLFIAHLWNLFLTLLTFYTSTNLLRPAGSESEKTEHLLTETTGTATLPAWAGLTKWEFARRKMLDFNWQVQVRTSAIVISRTILQLKKIWLRYMLPLH